MSSGPVLSTFGLIRPEKCLELAIASLPTVLARHPSAQYLIAGVTHADTKRYSGDTYREELAARSRQLGVEDSVHLLDIFLTETELVALLRITDVYLTPYGDRDQTSSGTLTYAVSAGCAVVSTAYRYAEELLTMGEAGAAGVLVPFDDSDALASGILSLLDQPLALARARKAALELKATLTWPAVAERLVRLVHTVICASRPTAVASTPSGDV